MGRDTLVSDGEEPNMKPHSDVTRLPREDMWIYGHCPERDTFCVVVCEVCHALVKPQAMRRHMDLRHKACPLESVALVKTSETELHSSVVPKARRGRKRKSSNIKLKERKKVPNPNISNVQEKLLSTSPERNDIFPVCVNDISRVDGFSKENLLLQSENTLDTDHNQAVSTSALSLQFLVDLTPLQVANEFVTNMSMISRTIDNSITTASSGKLNNTSEREQVPGLSCDGSKLFCGAKVSAASSLQMTELPSCVVSLPAPLLLTPEGRMNGILATSSDPQSPFSPTFAPTLSTPQLPSPSPSFPQESAMMAVDSFIAPHPSHQPSDKREVKADIPITYRPLSQEQLATLEYNPKLEEVLCVRCPPEPTTSSEICFHRWEE